MTSRIVTDAVLRNVTLYVPLPVHDNASYVGRNIIDTGFSEDDPSLATDTFSMYQYAYFTRNTCKIRVNCCQVTWQIVQSMY
jgi:hypothetical protein